MTSARRRARIERHADEIKAAAGALEAGVSDRDLARAAAAAGKRPVTMPLAVLTDLIGRAGAESPTATNLVHPARASRA